MEQRLATLTDIKDLQSVSNANYSMVMLEFEDSVNMDTVSSDILQKINLVEGNWEDAVGTPTIMKLNPNMIPVSVAAVDYKGKDRAELSSFVSDTLMNQLEGITGVASIDTSGILEEKVNVVISQTRSTRSTTKFSPASTASFASAQSELDAQKGKVQQGKKPASRSAEEN